MRKRQESPTLGLYFHFYNRGIGGGRIFFDPGNFYHCLRLVKKYSKRYQIAVIAYCLMPNHYHFLLRQDGNHSPSKLIQTVFNAYVQAVNKQHRRKGTLFEGRSKHIHIDREEYLIHLCRYIHLNPVKSELAETPEKWIYSNYLDWIETRDGTLMDENFIRDHFSTSSDYQSFVNGYRDTDESDDKMEEYLLE